MGLNCCRVFGHNVHHNYFIIILFWIFIFIWSFSCCNWVDWRRVLFYASSSVRKNIPGEIDNAILGGFLMPLIAYVPQIGSFHIRE